MYFIACLTWVGVLLAPVAQLDRAPDFESGGQGFESLPARHQTSETSVVSRVGLDRASTQCCYGSNMEAAAPWFVICAVLFGSIAVARTPARGPQQPRPSVVLQVRLPTSAGSDNFDRGVPKTLLYFLLTISVSRLLPACSSVCSARGRWQGMTRERV
jgi:hypothetical protein